MPRHKTKTSFKKGMIPWNKNGMGKEKSSKMVKKFWIEGVYSERDLTGEKNPNFRHGKLMIKPYKYILKEKKNICEICKSSENIIVHHKDRNRLNNLRNNLQILCQGCHMVLHCHGRKKLNERKR